MKETGGFDQPRSWNGEVDISIGIPNDKDPCDLRKGPGGRFSENELNVLPSDLTRSLRSIASCASASNLGGCGGITFEGYPGVIGEGLGNVTVRMIRG